MVMLVPSGSERRMTSITVIFTLCLSCGISIVLSFSNTTDVPANLPDDKDEISEYSTRNERRSKEGRALDDQPQLDDSGQVLVMPNFVSRRRQNRLVPIPVLNRHFSRDDSNFSDTAYPSDVYSALQPGIGYIDNPQDGHSPLGIRVVNPSRLRHYSDYDDAILEVPMDMQSDHPHHGSLPTGLLEFLQQSVSAGDGSLKSDSAHRVNGAFIEKKRRRSKIALRGHGPTETVNKATSLPSDEKDLRIDGPHVWIIEEQQLPAFLESLGIHSDQEPVDRFSSVNEESNVTSFGSRHPDVFVFGTPHAVNSPPQLFYDHGTSHTDSYFHLDDEQDGVVNSTESQLLFHPFNANVEYHHVPESVYPPYSINIVGNRESSRMNKTDYSDRNIAPPSENTFQYFQSLREGPEIIQNDTSDGSETTYIPDDNTVVTEAAAFSTANNSDVDSDSDIDDGVKEMILDDAKIQNVSQSEKPPSILKDTSASDTASPDSSSEQGRAQQDDTYLNFLRESNIGSNVNLKRVVQPYIFGYDQTDDSGTQQHRKEMSDSDGQVKGNYGYRDASGIYREVNYVADENGFRAFVKTNEPGTVNSSSANVVVMAEKPPRAVMLKIQTIQRRNQTAATEGVQNEN